MSGVSDGGIGLDVPREVVEKHEGKILKGFREVERATLTPHRDGTNAVSIFRCEGCRSLNTDYSVHLLGKCWKCGGHKMSGGSPTFLETEALIRKWDVVFFNWKHFLEYGEWGRGRSVGRALLDSLKRLPHTLLYQLVAPWEYHGKEFFTLVGAVCGKKGGGR